MTVKYLPDQQTIDYVDFCIEQKLVHEIHTSGRRAFRQCRRKWDWSFNKAYYPKRTAKPLEFGAAYHEAQEVYYDPKTWDEPAHIRIEKAIEKFVETCQKQRRIAEQTEDTVMIEAVEKDYDDRIELGKGMLRYYFEEIAPKEDIGWRPVKVEIGFMIAIPHPETGDYLWCKCDVCWDTYIAYAKQVYEETQVDNHAPRHLWIGAPVVYAGRIDMLAEDLKHKGNYFIFDWKTAAAISQTYDFLYLDDQIGSYCWALSKLGLNIRGFVYHEQRKGYPQPPKKNKQRRLGCLFSVAKNQDTNYDMYKETIMREDFAAYKQGLYDDMLTWLKAEGTVYYNRVKVTKANVEYETIEQNIGYEALEMINPSLALYPSPSKQGCSWCAFKTPCIEMNVHGDYMTALSEGFVVKEHYYVRKDSDSEEGGDYV